MSRVHGDTKISRKEQVEQLTPYGKYRESLRADFGRICGYCGKSELVTKNIFEMDHFIPQRLAPEKVNDYSNLVYSCYECNRKKAGKWLSENKDIQFVDGRGFVDPATDDFDTNLERDDEGNIVAKTPAGRYMVEIGFEFNKRPIKEIYKAMKLIEKKHQLEKKIKTLSGDEAQQYISFSMALEKFQQTLFDYKE
ncbi:MAG: HNH endonuclease signature motif containing protein [Lachnospiraceae bacterium]|nr:HNH endonuclease signature motif containing protein [Lachnospiraceae bacterium]